MASGYARKAYGAYNSTGASLDVPLPFTPKAVHLFTASGDGGYWNETMADASAWKRVTAGTGSFITSGGVTPLAAGGFNIGTDADLNPGTSELVYFEATE